MDKMKQWVALTVVGVLAVLAGGWFLLVSPKRSDAAELRSQADVVNSKLTALDAQLSVLKAQQKQMPMFQAKLAQVQAKLPNNPALPALIRALTAAADKAGVELVTVAPNAPVAFQPGGGAAPAGLPAASGTTPKSSAAAAPAAGPLQVIALSMNVVGGYFETEQFFDQLENLSRALKVTGFSMAPGANPLKAPATGTASAAAASSELDGSVLTTALTASVFMSPSTAPASAVPAPVK